MALQRVFPKDTQYVSSKDISDATDHLTSSEREELITKAILLGASFENADPSDIPAWVAKCEGRQVSAVHRYSTERAAAEFLILYGVLPNTGPV